MGFVLKARRTWEWARAEGLAIVTNELAKNNPVKDGGGQTEKDIA